VTVAAPRRVPTRVAAPDSLAWHQWHQRRQSGAHQAHNISVRLRRGESRAQQRWLGVI